MMTKACELKKKKVQYKYYLQSENERKHILVYKTDELWKKSSFHNNRPDRRLPILIWMLVNQKKKKIKQLIFASSQPVSNQTWRFTVAPIGLLVNCHLPTVFDPFCEHRLKCNTGITNTHNNIIHWDFSCHSEVVIQTKKKT